MKLSQTTSRLFECFDYEEGIKTAAEAGFDALDFHFGRKIYDDEFSEEVFEKTAEKIRRTAEKYGICFNQSHAPYPVKAFDENGEKMNTYDEKTTNGVIRSIKAAAALGAKIIVVHPTFCSDKQKQKRRNYDFYESLVPLCQSTGIKIALENMWRVDPMTGRITSTGCSFANELADYIDGLDPQYFTVCLDPGHSGLIGENAEDAVKILGNRIGTLHVHDNNKIDDLHTLPFAGTSDWRKITSALSDVSYNGDFTFEVADKFLTGAVHRPELMKQAFKLMATLGRQLIGMIE